MHINNTPIIRDDILLEQLVLIDGQAGCGRIHINRFEEVKLYY
jgi:hypothetical protein